MAQVQGDFRAEVSRAVATQIGRRAAPWQQKLATGEASNRFEFPFNGHTGYSYRGGNGLLLMLKAQQLMSEDPRWFTPKQIRDNGFQINRGRRGTVVEYWNTYTTKDETDPVSGAVKQVKVPLAEPQAFYGVVYNAAELSNVPAYEPRTFPQDWDAAQQITKLIERSGAKIVHDQSVLGFYDPIGDQVHVPPRERFLKPLEYENMVIQELGHWSGHSSRMARYISSDRESMSYSKEILRVQIASLFIAVEMGMPFDARRHLDRSEDWVRALLNDPNELFRVARDAEAIAYAVLNLGADRDLHNEQTQAQAVEQPVVPKVLTASEQFEFDRANPKEGIPENLVCPYAFGKFAGAIGEDRYTVYTRWHQLGTELFRTATAEQIVQSMQDAIASGVPEHLRQMLIKDDHPGEEVTFEEAHSWARVVEERMRSASEFLDAHEICIADAERVGVSEEVISNARLNLRQTRTVIREQSDAPDKLLETLRQRAQRETERLFSNDDLKTFSKKPTAGLLGEWMETSYKGQAVYTNGVLIDISASKPHVSGLHERARPGAISAQATERIVSGCVNQYDMTKLELIAGLDREDAPAGRKRCCVFKRSDNEPAIYVDPGAIRYFQSKFRGAEFHAAPLIEANASRSLKVMHQGALVGVLMPLTLPDRRETAAEVEQYLRNNEQELEHQAVQAAATAVNHHVPLDLELLSKQPTPASIKGWMKGEWDGKTVFMTDELLDLSGEAPAVKCWEQRINEQRPQLHSSTIQRAIDGSCKDGLMSTEPIAMLKDESRTVVAFSRKPDEQCVYIDSAFVRYFQHVYGDALEYRVGEGATSKSATRLSYPSVQVIHDRQLVGVVAPVNIADRALTATKVIEQISGVPREPVAQKASLQPVKRPVDHANGFTKGMPPVAANKLRKALNKEVLLNGRVDTVRGHLERWHGQNDLSFTCVKQNRIKPMSHTAYNAASYVEQREHENRVKAGGKITVYLVNNIDLGKVAHDYAVHLSKLSRLEMRDATDRDPMADDVVVLAEIALETGDVEVLDEFKLQFGVAADRFIGMNQIDRCQHLANHYAAKGAQKAQEPSLQAQHRASTHTLPDMSPSM